MSPVGIVRDLSPYARVFTAVLPFLVAIVTRLIVGKNRVTRIMLSISTLWFVVNVLLAPYSAAMRQDILKLSNKLW